MNKEQTELFIQGKARCTACLEVKSLEDFYKNNRKENGRRSQCKICSVKIGNAYSKKRQESGWSQEEYDEVWEQQDKACFICRRAKRPDEPAFAADHDHVTGQKRAILCPGCNLMLGHAKDNPDILRTGARYIEFFRNIADGSVLDPGDDT